MCTKQRENPQNRRDYGAYNVRVFGSVARGEETPQSDIDSLWT
jgi:predicted nucleotidyltransferase